MRKEGNVMAREVFISKPPSAEKCTSDSRLFHARAPCHVGLIVLRGGWLHNNSRSDLLLRNTRLSEKNKSG